MKMANSVVCVVVVSAIVVVPTALIGKLHWITERSLISKKSLRESLPSDVRSNAARSLDSLPLSFEPNVGQTDPQVRFLSHGGGYELFLTADGAVVTLTQTGSVAVPRRKWARGHHAAETSDEQSSNDAVSTAILRLRLQDPNPRARIIGLDDLAGRVNYFTGNDPKNWHVHVPTYSRVEYQNVYPGVDLSFYGRQQKLEYDFIVNPGADPRHIRFHIDGSSETWTDHSGNLQLMIAHSGRVVLKKPGIYQEQNGIRQEIAGGFIVEHDGAIRFDINSYDTTKPLIIDPVLDYSTYLGGSNYGYVNGIAVDSQGDVFVAGWTAAVDFPTTSNSVHPGPLSSVSYAGFVSEINPTATGLIYSTYFTGNSKNEFIYDMFLDSANPPNVYIGGSTSSTDFPTTQNAYLTTFTPSAASSPGGGGAGFVTKFNPAVNGLNALVYSTYLGGNSTDWVENVSVDATGNIYVAGGTYSTNFPTTSGAFQSVNNAPSFGNVFITRFDPTRSGAASLIYSTYVGGSGTSNFPYGGDYPYGMRLGSNNNVYIAGTTGSIDFPTTASAFAQTAPPATQKYGTGFVARVDTTAGGAAALVYSTYLGGSGNWGDLPFYSIVGSGNLTYVTGWTFSADFPTTPGSFMEIAPSGTTSNGIGFVSVIDASQSGTNSLIYSTFLGTGNGQGKSPGLPGDAGSGLAVDSTGNVYVSGETFSSGFPVTQGAYQTSIKGTCTGFISELMPLGNGAADLVYSTFFGGTEPSATCYDIYLGGTTLTLDSSDNLYAAGATQATDFPISPSNAFQTSLTGGSMNDYIAKLTLAPKVLPTPSITSLSVSSGTTGTNVTISGTNFGTNQGTSKVKFGSATANIVSWGSNSVVAQVPSEGTPGVVQVSVTTSVGTSNTKPFTIIPTITSLSPYSGPIGASVTISGANFGTSGSVTFNGTAATTTSWGQFSVVAIVPSGATTGNVVLTSSSIASNGVQFTVVPTPSITNLSQSSGTAGIAITITGTNFGSSQSSEAGNAVFNGANAYISSWSSTSIVALIPSTAAPGLGSVSVTAGGAQSNSIAFTVNPSIGSLSPSVGPVGQTVVIAGSDFGSTQGSGTVKFGGLTATVNSWTPMSISAVVPSLAVGSVSVTITAGSVQTNSLLFTISGASGSAPPPNPPVTGLPPFATIGGGPFDKINLGNLNVHFDIPVLSKPGRGTNFNYTLKYDSSVWSPSGAPGAVSWQPVANWGWAGQSDVVLGSLSYLVPVSGTCSADGKPYTTYYGWSYRDSFGVAHAVNMGGLSNDLLCGSDPQTGTTTDGSGYSISVYAVPQSTPQSFNATVTSRAGKQISAPVAGSTSAGVVADRNGNQISVNSSGVFTDTLGTTALTITGGAPSPLKFGYTPPAGGTVYVTVNYTTYSVQTAFGCSGIQEYSNSNVPLVTSVVYPDGTSYQFTYEFTPGSTTTVTGRLAKVTVPTGGTLTYSYSGGSNGITCGDGTAATLTRATSDGTWTYAHSESGTAWTTAITNTDNEDMTLNFQGIYETQKQVSGVKTVITCYNGNTTNCNSTPVNLPITQRTTFVQWPGTGGLQSRKDTFYNANGLVTERDEFAYGAGSSGSLAKKTLITYASLGNGINNMPASVSIQDGSGNIKGQTTYAYDQTAVVATSGTPQHVSVSGSRGNVTTVSYLTQGSTTLNKTYTYFDTGTIQTATDVNGAQTTYTYGACGNSFATLVNEPLNLSRSMTWNCTGAVQTNFTDENNESTLTNYTDADFWRPSSSTDPTNAVTSVTYTGANFVEQSLSFNSGSSTVDLVSKVDLFGRTSIQQKRQAPGSSNFDSVQSGYDHLGRPKSLTVPYVGTYGSGTHSAATTNTAYDALNRVTSVTDGGGGTTTYSYTQNDVLITESPAPNSENTKRRQLEYDSLGHLTSVCEITSAAGSGTCGQTVSQTGYWTIYTYDVVGHLTGVTQNAQSGNSTQSRSYTYDLMGRMTSATDPESGNLPYTFAYDTDATCGTSKGDLVKRVDSVGNVTCYSYDALHRQTSITYPSGSYASKTPSKYFIYDSATVNGTVMSNAKGRPAEAYTCVAPCSTKLTDIGMSYTVRGEPSDVYESTPNSGGYYRVSEQYWPNGAIEQLSGLSSLPTFTFNVDGEGRMYQVSASSGQNPATNTSFNAASLPTSVTFGSQDSDSFTYDPNTNRMTQYQFTVNGQSLTGSLTWNANSTLRELNISDAFNTADNQSCSYVYDDLARLTSTDCGTAWSQTYSYDPFGNISKSGSAAFQPTYDLTTNRIKSVSGFNPTYDNNGNTLSDPLHTYSWDSAGKPVAIDSVNMTYDALGRMVEQNRSGTYTQIVYGPHGGKFAIFSGQTLQKAFIPLPGGTQAVYSASGLLYYGHSDHLGSIRLGSTTTRTVSFDIAYAPFGETYAASGSTDPSFTGQRQDTVAGLYDFPVREYSSQGRWPSPDPLGVASLKAKDPQTLNRYVYARNTPTTLIDPFGTEFCDDVSGGCFDYDWGGYYGGGVAGTDPGLDSTPSVQTDGCGADDPACLGSVLPSNITPQNPLNPYYPPSTPPPPPPGVLTVSLLPNPITGEVSLDPGETVGGTLTTSQPLSSGTATATATLFSNDGNEATGGTVGIQIGIPQPSGPAFAPGSLQVTTLSVTVPSGSNNGSFGFTGNGYLEFSITDSQGNQFVGSISVTVGRSAGQTLGTNAVIGSTPANGGQITFKVP